MSSNRIIVCSILLLVVSSVSGFHFPRFRQGHQRTLTIAYDSKPVTVAVDRTRIIQNHADSDRGFASDVEEIYRTYPFHDKVLPTLRDCNNYYSGQFNSVLWHQDADQVMVYIPIANSVGKDDVKAKFSAQKVEVFVDGKLEIKFECRDKIVPDGSFWLLETDQNGERYVQLDLEKRHVLINWPTLFRVTKEEDADQITPQQTDLLQKLYEANLGMSKMTGKPAETIEDMMADPRVMESLMKEEPDSWFEPAEEGKQ